MGMKISVFAVIVTYNTDKEFPRRLNPLLGQVDRILIVDNGSGAQALENLRGLLKTSHKIELIENGENFGLATALNIGVRRALGEGCDWILTLDDDSEVENDMIAEMLKTYFDFSDEEKENIAVLAPNYTILKGPVHTSKIPVELPGSITSGELIKKQTFQKIGFFLDDFFIYCIDTEFSFRLRKNKLKIILVPGALLHHHMGENPHVRNVFGKKIIVPNDSPWRYYYTIRNSLYLYGHYWKNDFKSVLGCMISNIYLVTRMLFFEQEKIKKIRMITWGILDAISGNYGKLKHGL